MRSCLKNAEWLFNDIWQQDLPRREKVRVPECVIDEEFGSILVETPEDSSWGQVIVR